MEKRTDKIYTQLVASYVRLGSPEYQQIGVIIPPVTTTSVPALSSASNLPAAIPAGAIAEGA
jgi:hypothetical protein